MVDARAGEFFEAVQHQVAHISGPLRDDAQTEGTCLPAQIHHVAVDAPHFENQGAYPVGALGAI